MSETRQMPFTMTATNREALDMYFGKPSAPTYSVMIDHVQLLSAEPRRPQPLAGWRGWLDRLTGRRSHALRLWAIRRAAWVEAGCPMVPSIVRTYIPRATLTPTDASEPAQADTSESEAVR